MIESGTFIGEEGKKVQINENTATLSIRCSLKDQRKQVHTRAGFFPSHTNEIENKQAANASHPASFKANRSGLVKAVDQQIGHIDERGA